MLEEERICDVKEEWILPFCAWVSWTVRNKGLHEKMSKQRSKQGSMADRQWLQKVSWWKHSCLMLTRPVIITREHFWVTQFSELKFWLRPWKRELARLTGTSYTKKEMKNQEPWAWLSTTSYHDPKARLPYYLDMEWLLGGGWAIRKRC